MACDLLLRVSEIAMPPRIDGRSATMLDGSETLLVTGASGGLGQSVIGNLLDVYDIAPERIIAVTRSPDRIAHLASRGIAVREGDFDKPDELVSAFSGADRVLIISVGADPLESYLADTDSLGNPNRQRVVRQIGAVNAVERAGAGHVVYTSAPNPEPPTVCFWKRDHWHTEEAIRSSGLGWSILRMWEYPDFHLTYSWAQSLATGEFIAGSGDGRCAFISREDCARAAAAALTRRKAGNRIYDIAGREALTIDHVMALLSAVSGRPISVKHTSPQEMRMLLEAKGEELAPVYAAFHQGMAQGKYDSVGGDFEELTGAVPSTLERFFRTHPVSDAQMQVIYRFADHPA
jgi:NAD(P)H dehydrogenase (quinone)